MANRFNKRGRIIDVPLKRDLGLKELERVKGCGKHYHRVKHTECGALITHRCKCNSRWCPECFKDMSSEYFNDVYTAVKGMKYPSHVVLTIKDVAKGGLPSALKFIKRAFTNLSRSKFWKENVKGGYVGVGLTWHGDWHLHLHLAIDAVWLDKWVLLEKWKKFTEGRGNNVWVDRASDRKGLAREIMKGTRGDMVNLLKAFDGDSDLFNECVHAFKHKKWVMPFGNVIRRDPPEKKHCHCPRCGVPVNPVTFIRDKISAEEFHWSKYNSPVWADYYDKWVFKPEDSEGGKAAMLEIGRVERLADTG